MWEVKKKWRFRLLMRMLGSRWHRTHCPTCFVERRWTKCLVCLSSCSSSFPSTRTNLSPFTKDFRGGEQFEWVYRLIFRRPAFQRGTWIKGVKNFTAAEWLPSTVNGATQIGGLSWECLTGGQVLLLFSLSLQLSFPEKNLFCKLLSLISICEYSLLPFSPRPQILIHFENKFTFSLRYWVLKWCVFPL